MDMAVTYSAKQVDMIMDSAKTLLPVTTAYLALAAATAKYTFETQQLSLRRHVVALLAIFGFGLAAIGAWIVSIAGIADAARAFDLATNAPPSHSVKFLQGSWSLAVLGQQVAVLSLFVSMSVYCAFLLYTFILAHRAASDELIKD
jgi:hypothetical protein